MTTALGVLSIIAKHECKFLTLSVILLDMRRWIVEAHDKKERGELVSVLRLTQIESSIQRLSLQEQLRLLEWMVQTIRTHTLFEPNSLEKELAEMAADPEIIRELKAIEEEFSFAEADGLEAV